MNGAWVRYSGLQFGPAVNAVEIKYSCDDAHAGGTIALRLDRPDAPPVATMKVDSTGNYRRYVSRVLPIGAVMGNHDLILTFTGNGPGVANVSSLTFRRTAPTTATAPKSIFSEDGE